VAAWPLAVSSQQGDRVRRIGVLMAGVESDPMANPNFSAFTRALASLGWTSRNLRMDIRWGGGETNRMGAPARELVGLQPDIIVTQGGPATIAVQRETRTIPIVFTIGVDPVIRAVSSPMLIRALPGTMPPSIADRPLSQACESKTAAP
jgi:putative ABC transport system substrate-binding protein